MTPNDASDLVDRLTADLPATDAPVAQLVAAGRAARRRRRRTLTVGAAALTVAAIAAGVVVPRLGTSDDRPDVLNRGADGARAVVYFVTADPDSDSQPPAETRLVPRLVDAHDTGDPGLDALEALQAARPDDLTLTNGLNFLRTSGESFLRATSVTHGAGVITVDLAADPMDPYPNVDFVGPSGETVTQEVVLTVQTALESTDPVLFTVNGEPARGILGSTLSGPVAGEPNLILGNPSGAGDKDAVSMTITPAVAAPGQVVTITYATDWVRGVPYELVPVKKGAEPDLEAPDYYLTSDGGRGVGAMPWHPASDKVAWDDIGIGGRGPDRVAIPDTAADGTWLLCTANAQTDSCAEVTVLNRDEPALAPDVLDARTAPVSDKGVQVSVSSASQGASLVLSTHGSSSCPYVIDSVRRLDDETVVVTAGMLVGSDGLCTADFAPLEDQWPLADALPDVRFAIVDLAPIGKPVRVAVERTAPSHGD